MSARSGKALRIVMLVLAVVSVTAAATNGPVEGSLAAWTRQLITGDDDVGQHSAAPRTPPDGQGQQLQQGQHGRHEQQGHHVVFRSAYS